jgi:hypothetical protein
LRVIAMQRIKQSEATAARRRIPLPLLASAGVGWDGVVTGITAMLSVSGAVEIESTNDIVKTEIGNCYIELTQAEAASVGVISARVAAASGLLQCVAYAQVVGFDPYAGLSYTAANLTGTISF